MSFPVGPLAPVSRSSDRTQWGGKHTRLMLQTIYIVAFLCLLRFDEALSITWDNVHFEDWEGTFRVRLDLPVRKTHQCGGMFASIRISQLLSEYLHVLGIAPFYLYPNYDRPWLCPVHLLALWWKTTVEEKVDLREKGSYVFRKKIGKDRVSLDADASMVSFFHDLMSESSLNIPTVESILSDMLSK